MEALTNVYHSQQDVNMYLRLYTKGNTQKVHFPCNI